MQSCVVQPRTLEQIAREDYGITFPFKVQDKSSGRHKATKGKKKQ